MITMPLIPPNKKIPSLTTSVAVTSILNSHVYRGPRPSETRSISYTSIWKRPPRKRLLEPRPAGMTRTRSIGTISKQT